MVVSLHTISAENLEYNYFSRDLVTCVYAIIAGLEVNWVKIMFDNIVKEHTSFLTYGAFLSHVFRKFKLDLSSKTSVVKVFEPFDRAILHRMKLLDLPLPQPQPQQQRSSPSQSSTQAPSSTQPPSTEPPSTQLPPTFFLDVFYNSLSAEILAVQNQQASMIASQTALLNNQSLLMEHFMNM